MNMERVSDSRVVLPFATVQNTNGTTGITIDTQHYRSLSILLARTAGTIDSVSFTESDLPSSGFAAIPAAETLFQPGAIPLSSGNLVIGCIAKKRYVRFNVVAASASYSAMGFLGDSLVKPHEVNASILANGDVNSPDATADASSTIPKRPVS